MTSPYEQALLSVVEENPDVIVLTADGTARASHVPPELEGRYIDVGIGEQALVGVAAGLAVRGRRVVAQALATFLVHRAFEFIRTDVGVARLAVTLVGVAPGFLSEAGGPTHQAIDDIAVLRAIPAMQIVCPSDAVDLAEALPEVIASRLPTYVRLCARPPAVQHLSPFRLGRAEVLSEGTDVAILTYGMLLGEAARARELIEREGLTVRLINMRSLRPVDTHAIVRAATQCRMVVTLEDHLLTGGLFSIVCETLVAHRVTAHVVPIALQTWFRAGRLKDVLAHEGFSGEGICRRILTELAASMD